MRRVAGDWIWRPIPLLVNFLAAAFVLRLISFVYSVYNYDESLYILMGSELGKGHLPYTTICDLKPFGLFGLFSLFTALPFDGIIVSRIAACLAVGATAYLLSGVAGLLFDDESRSIGVTSGLTYIVFTLATGGVAAQGELFLNLFAVLALFLLLRALRDPVGFRASTLIGIGLCVGIGIQIKQSILFDILALFACFFILTTPRAADLPTRVRASALGLVVVGIVAILPTLAVMLTYGLAGEWDAWVAGNITAHRVFYGLERRFEFEPAFRAMWEQAPLWIAAALALAFSRRLACGNHEVRACVFLGLWFGSIIVCQVFLRIASDHYFLQFLPSASLMAGFVLARGVLDHVQRQRVRYALLSVLVGTMLFAIAKEPLLHTIYVLKDRLITAERWAGDTPRQVAADLASVLQPGDTIYVVGFQPIIYYMTQTRPATRFAFTGLPHRDYPGRDGCPWVEPRVEMQRILAARPKMIVVEDGIFFRELAPEVKSLLMHSLATDYRLRKRYEQHYMHHLYPFERFVMNGGAPVEVYELVAGDPAKLAEPNMRNAP